MRAGVGFRSMAITTHCGSRLQGKALVKTFFCGLLAKWENAVLQCKASLITEAFSRKRRRGGKLARRLKDLAVDRDLKTTS